jgi:hypothetical protein
MMDLGKVTIPILLHLLKGEVRFPKLFLLRRRLTVGLFKRRIDPRFPAELIDFAALPLWVYINLKRQLGQEKAFEIMRVAILTGSVAQWNLAYKTVETEPTVANLCDRELAVNRIGATRWNTLEVVERTASRSRSRAVHTMSWPRRSESPRSRPCSRLDTATPQCKSSPPSLACQQGLRWLRDRRDRH